MIKIKGNGVSGGIAIAKLHHFKSSDLSAVKKYAPDKVAEIKRLEDALKVADKELETLIQQANTRIGEEHAMIFSAHQMMLKDPEMRKNAFVKINDFNLDAAFAFKQTMSDMIDLFELSDNAYIKERISDLEDVTQRVLNILNDKDETIYSFEQDVILAAIDLLPSQTMHLDIKHIKGILLEKGSKTSHSAILARNLGIPAITGVDVSKLNEDVLVVMDGKLGELTVEPTKEMIQNYQEKLDAQLSLQSLYEAYKDKPALTKDQHRLNLAANIGVAHDLDEARFVNADGIGLFRTENQYLESNDFPTEKELYDVYVKTSEAFANNDIIIRTLDIGGDKNLSYLNMRKE